MKPMVSLVLAVCVVALLPGVAAAQQVSGGVKAGLALADLPNVLEAGDSTSLRTGVAVGGFLSVRFGDGFAIQPEVLYTQKGVRIADNTAQGAVNLDFVDVPVLARYTFGKGKARGFVLGGPSFDFKTRAKVNFTSDGRSEEEDISSDVETFEFALVFGGGVEIGRFTVEARWSEGLTNLLKDSTGDPENIKSRTFLVLGGVRF